MAEIEAGQVYVPIKTHRPGPLEILSVEPGRRPRVLARNLDPAAPTAFRKPHYVNPDYLFDTVVRADGVTRTVGYLLKGVGRG